MAQNPDMAAVLAALQQTVATLAQGQQDLTTVVGRLTPVRPAVGFHLSPAQFAHGDLIDLTSRAGKSIYEETQRGEEDKYDLSKSGLTPFAKQIQEASSRLDCSNGLTSVCHFTPDDATPAVNIIDHYGEVTTERITNQCAVFITGAESQRRQAQNNKFLVDYTLNSLTSKARTSLLTYESTFSIDGKIVWGLLWKRLVSVPSLDSKLTTKNLRDEIRDMPALMPMNIESWNEQFTNNMRQLRSRTDGTIDDPEDIILTAYLLADDARFVKYWEKRKGEIEDGEGPLATANWEALLSNGVEKYNGYKRDWGKLSKQEQDFLALKADYEGVLRGQLEMKSPPKAKGSSKKKSTSNPSKSSQKSAGPVSKNKKPTADRQRQKRDEAWKKIPPKDGEPHSKTVNDWKCFWCVHHMAWTGHSSAECLLGKRRASEQTQRDFKAASSICDPAVQHQQDFMAKLAGLSRLHE